MFSFAIRGMIAVGGLAAAIAIALNIAGPGRPSGAAPFAEVLDELRGLNTLELRVAKEGKSAEVWIRAPGLVRWQETPQRYQIANGSRLYKIDEAANTVTTGDSPWFLRPDKQVDLLGLLDVGVTESSPLLKARPSERAEFDGRDCNVYRADLPAKDGRVEIVAYADVKSKQLVGIVAEPAAGARAGRPLAELHLVAMNGPVDESKFIVAKSLTDDGRIGKVSDAQGVVLVRPALAQRWTPVAREMSLRAGDWLRTDIRGANAVMARLSADVELTLGPGTLVEFISPTEARLHTGEVQVNIPKPGAKPKANEPEVVTPKFELLAPREGSRKFATAGKTIVRANRNDQLVELTAKPKWLAGFEGTSADESLGSLIVNVDGRNEPLSVGYHKVTVEIRDQIARTTIEESFVNSTTRRLEGVFHFPLPQDASISDFGMWIGNDLVEADIVEKQRAREIYETILRERRDPGLLEWTGGNIFKARVFPIEPTSEKRIKIVYTQVLPLRAGKYRYDYGLRSELLRLKPLRELSLTVTVNSALPLKSVTCPTHSATVNQTAHSAQVAFAAQEYTPTRDFEVVCEIDGHQNDVVAIPHRRGNDGYFMVQLTPPAPEGNWQRELVADGQPLSIVLLCDTSASMDSEKRKEQAEFVASVLGALGEKDHFWLAASDVRTDWASKEPLSATADNIAKARDFLERRQSLGWTNLEQAFEAVAAKAPKGAQVVYIGDGIVTAGKSDPVEFVNKLGRMFAGDKADGRVFHAVTVGNSYESTVLKAIAGIGGGSVRSVGGDETPATVALALMKEISSPGLRDLNVEFRGVKVAAVYPDRLPNLAAGTQQILVGRYLPTGADQHGEIVVTGHRGNETIRYVAKLDLKDAEAGNSFIPRLWARAHLDRLLAQGQSQAVRDQIIALSEEFHIITPYTSLLVLETDADRQRFGVKRRFNMRNGEQFFAEGHDNANYELTQQQIKRAGDWRIGLRRQVLAMLARQGRDPRMFQSRRSPYTYAHGAMLGRYSGFGGGAGGGDADYLGDTYGMPGGGPLGESYGFSRSLGLQGAEHYPEPASLTPMSGEYENAPEEFSLREKDSKKDGDFDGTEIRDDGINVTSKSEIEEAGRPLTPEFDETKRLADAEGLEVDGRELSFALGNRRGEMFDSLSAGDLSLSASGAIAGKPYFASDMSPDYGFYAHRYRSWPNYTAWVDSLFPGLAPAERGPQPPKKAPENWSPEALALAKGLLRTEALKKMEGGIELRLATETLDPRWKRRTSQHHELALYSPSAWLTKPLDPEAQTIINYGDAKERGVFSLAFELGRVRKSNERDFATPPLPLADMSLTPLEDAYRGYDAQVEKGPAADQAVLVLKVKNSDYRQKFTIDTTRHVVLKIETFDKVKLTGATAFDDFVQIAGMWWARHVTTSDEKGRTTGETKLEIASLAAGKYAERIDAELAVKKNVLFMHLPLPSLADARKRVADGSAGFDDRLVMMLYNAGIQQWDEMLKQLEAVEKASADKPGVRWIRTVVLATIRRNEEARQQLLDEAKKLAAEKQQDELFLAGFLLSQGQGVASPAEFLEFVNLLKPVYDRQPAELDAKASWQDQLAGAYDRMGRPEEALPIKRTLAEQAPWDVNRQTDFARRLMQAGQAAAAYEWLDKQLARPEERTSSEDETLRSAYAQLYRDQSRWEDLLKFTTKWIERKPEYQSAYIQHLSTLIYNDKLDEANALAEKWLKEGQIEGKLATDQESLLEAAITFAQGNAYNVSFYRMDERWFDPLAAAVRFFATSKENFRYVSRILDYRFDGSDQADRLRGYFLKLLETDLGKLSPEQIGGLVGRTLSGRIELAEPQNGRKQLSASEIPDAFWKKVAEEIYKRWKETDAKRDSGDKNTLSEALRSIYATRFDDKLLPFLRERITAAGEDFKQQYIDTLFDTLLSRPWTDDVEKEAFALLRQLGENQESGDRLFAQVGGLYRLVDAMLRNRQSAAEAKLQDKGDIDKSTRKTRAGAKAEIRKTAKTELAKRLGEEAAKEKGPLAPWLRIEKAYLDVALDNNLKVVAEECWKLLGGTPPKIAEDDEAADQLTPQQLRERLLDSLLKHRAFVTVMNLAARKGVDAADIKRLKKFIEAGLAREGDAAAPWRIAMYQLLVALDRPDELEKALREWMKADASTAPWRKSLAMLLAERGQFKEAISLFEAAEKEHLLTASDYRSLADWYKVVDNKEAYNRARIEAFKQLPEQRLAAMFYGVRSRWLQTSLPLPSELDENTLLAMKALFEKSAAPENYLWQLRELYAACRDFRLLQMLPDAMLGRSPQQVYSFLQNLQGQILGEIRNESTSDKILERIKELREGKPTQTDLRALDLLEAIVERRASEVLNQRGPHVDATVVALKRAFDRPWGDGEPRMMSMFLRGLGTLPDAKLSNEQLREVRALVEKSAADKTASGRRDHLHIVEDLCHLLFESYGKHEEAIQTMEVAVRAYEQANDGHWPYADDDVLSNYVSFLESDNHHAAGEAVLLKYAAKPDGEQQKNWFEIRLAVLYNSALEADGEVSLGHGNGLMLNIIAAAKRRIDKSSDETVRFQVVTELASTFEIASRKHLADTAAEVRKYAFELVPAVLKRQVSQYQSTASQPLRVVELVLGPKAALRYVVERMEQYPQWLEIGWSNAWNSFGGELARLRETAAGGKESIEDLEPRVLKLAIRELKRDLRTGERRNPAIYTIHSQFFWAAKSADFAKAAEEVYREYKSSGRRVMYVADYLWGGLELHSRAIEVLLVAHRDGILDEGQQVQLVHYLQADNRYAESISILEPLVNLNPDSMPYRTLLMQAYFHSQRPEQLRELVAETDKHFHEKGRWVEGNIAEFGRGCLLCGLLDKATTYLTEAIKLHQAAHPGSTIGDAELSGMYQQLADAYSGLGNTEKAVDAAAGAIVCWGPMHSQRADALRKLDEVLAHANDLDKYVASLDAAAAKADGKDSPVIRKAIGKTYQAQGKFGKAIAQYKIAIELQPNDVETRQALIQCYIGDRKEAEATNELLALIDIDRHNLALYQQLAERLKNNEAEADRAATSIVEAGPKEAENHAALAELREKQGRWKEAVSQWEEAADLRKLEPTNLIKLAGAQIHVHQLDAARESIKRLQHTEWPSRFANVDNEVRRLQDELKRQN